MSYVVVGNKIIDSEEILKLIREAEPKFKKVRDLTKGSKREDTLVYQIVLDVNHLKKELTIEGQGEEIEPEDLVEELMSLADEKIYAIEEVIPEDFISYGYSYHYDDGQEEIKAIFVAVDEKVGELRVRDVAERILRSLD